MNYLMRLLAPRSKLGFAVRLILLTAVVVFANLAFTYATLDEVPHGFGYYVAQAAVVGGPFVAFFLAASVSQIKLQRQLWFMSRRDGLTGLYNRTAFIEKVRADLVVNHKSALMIIDADEFKSINDTYGHQSGDRCLIAIAGRLSQTVRSGDLVCRMGGEEFAIYLPNTSAKDAVSIGERLIDPITFTTCNDDLASVTLSVGAAETVIGHDLNSTFVTADRALYDAKLAGRARMVMTTRDAKTILATGAVA